MSDYLGIEFSDDFQMDYKTFEKSMNASHVFKNMNPNVRESEIKKAYKIATNGNTKRAVEKSKTNQSKKD